MPPHAHIICANGQTAIQTLFSHTAPTWPRACSSQPALPCESLPALQVWQSPRGTGHPNPCPAASRASARRIGCLEARLVADLSPSVLQPTRALPDLVDSRISTHLHKRRVHL